MYDVYTFRDAECPLPLGIFFFSMAIGYVSNIVPTVLYYTRIKIVEQKRQ